MANDWRDGTSYSRGERGTTEPTTWELDLGGLRVVVHRLHGVDDTWFGSCHAMGIDRHQLNSKIIDRARVEFVGYCHDRAKRWEEKLTRAIVKEHRH